MLLLVKLERLFDESRVEDMAGAVLLGPVTHARVSHVQDLEGHRGRPVVARVEPVRLAHRLQGVEDDRALGAEFDAEDLAVFLRHLVELDHDAVRLKLKGVPDKRQRHRPARNLPDAEVHLLDQEIDDQDAHKHQTEFNQHLDRESPEITKIEYNY